MTNDSDKTHLGIDYGTRRIGVAKCDSMGIIASALVTLEVKSRKQAVKKICELIAEYQPVGIVFGYPLLASGDISKKCLEIDRFIELLQPEFDGPIHRTDERYTSVEAQAIIHAHGKKVGQDKKRIDRLAAVLILQRYLDEQL